MEVADLLNHVREEVLRDSAKPYLFSDDSLLKYLNEGYKQFARKTHYFTEEFTLTTQPSVGRYELPPGTLHVRQIQVDGRWLTPFTRRAKPRIFEGRPTAYTTDTAQRWLKLYPKPDQAYNLVIERAYTPAELDRFDDILLPDEWAMLLAEWVTYRALRNNDPDASNTVSADTFLARWEIGLRDAKRELMQLSMGDDMSPQPRAWT